MKRILLLTALITGLNRVNAQNGLENIIVEKYYISDAADSAGSTGLLPVGSVTYRIFADLLPGYNFQALYGVPGHSLIVSTTTSFFNNEDYGTTTPTISSTNVRKNSAMIDSWFSVGGSANGKAGVLKADDTDGSLGNNIGILANNNPNAGIPLTTSDGMIAGSPVAVTFVGINNTGANGDLGVLDGTSQVGGLFSTDNGSVAALGGSTGPTADNRVLVGQFTTDGNFCFELNLQIGTPGGGVENYVALNPTGNEIQIPSLLYCSTSGINDAPFEVSTIGVYPNPATDYLSVDLIPSKKENMNSINIYDVTGRCVYRHELGNHQAKYFDKIDVTGFNRGLYLVEIVSGEDRIVRKWVKK